MKRYIFIVWVLLSCFVGKAQYTGMERENPAVNQINRERMHAHFIPYTKEAELLLRNGNGCFAGILKRYMAI